MRKFLGLVMILGMCAVANGDDFHGSFKLSIGDQGDGPEGRIYRLEQALVQLEQIVNNLQARVSYLERAQVPAPVVPIPIPQRVACLLNDDFGKAYIGHGANEIEARGDAERQCNAANALGCQNSMQCQPE